MIVCSIDLIGGKAVQLERGERQVLERDDVLALAERFGRLGEIAVIDLDAAFGRGDNRELIEQLCRVAHVRVGGGIRDLENARRYLRAGARRVILGTGASPELLSELPRERTIVAIDARDGRVATNGWRTLSPESPLERAQRLQPYCGGFLFTDIDREGMLAGIDVAKITALKDALDVPLTAAGGVRTVDEVAALDAIGVDAQVGMAIYTGLIDPAVAFAATIDFTRGDGLVPTVACDARSGRVRMVGYSSRESLLIALRDGVGVYWSRSRSAIWRKGETSGATQRLVRVSADCDRDALMFYVEQEGATCHSGALRCFGDAPFAWDDLMMRIDDRIERAPQGSYTRRLMREPAFLSAKLREEIDEVIVAPDAGNLAWECADVLYFLSVKMRASGIRIDDVMAQLAARAI
jgi:phosphoribosyl-AMP cyclohydrolase / phosphoribosyl-ATP pyrophosphohydrolase